MIQQKKKLIDGINTCVNEAEVKKQLQESWEKISCFGFWGSTKLWANGDCGFDRKLRENVWIILNWDREELFGSWFRKKSVRNYEDFDRFVIGWHGQEDKRTVKETYCLMGIMGYSSS
jgi:hypothetical protein